MLAQPVVDSADHPEVHDPDPPGRFDEEVAGMRIGMKKAVVEDHLGGDERSALGERVTVEAGFVNRRKVGDLQLGGSVRA